MLSTELAMDLIKDYIYEFSNHEYSPRQKMEFKQETFGVWAATELLIELSKNPNIPPLTVMEKFRDKMDNYSCLNRHNSFIFSVAKDTTEYLIDQLIKG